MKFNVLINTSTEERRILKKAAATIGLIDQPLGDEKAKQVKRAIHLLGDNSGFNLTNLDLAIKGFNALKGELEKMSHWGAEDWGFRNLGPIKQPKLLRRGVGAPLANRVRPDPPKTVPLIANPIQFMKDMAELRKSQLPDVEDALAVLQRVRKKMKAMVTIADTFGDGGDDLGGGEEVHDDE